MASAAILRRRQGGGHHENVDEDTEVTQLMLETLFDIKVAVVEIHRALFGRDDDDEEETEEDA